MFSFTLTLFEAVSVKFVFAYQRDRIVDVDVALGLAAPLLSSVTEV